MHARHLTSVLLLAFAVIYVEPASRMQAPGGPF
jgi:hypothetical protein